MPPPSKCVLRLRAAGATRWSLHTNSKISNYKQLIEPSESISISSDDDIYPIESDSEIDDEAVNRAKNLILKWKDGAKPKRPAAYTKDSRTTKWRKMKQQAKRAASAANCHLITHFLFKSSETTISADESADYPSDSSSDEDQDNINFSNISVEKALELVVAYVSVSVNQSHERRLGAVTKYDYVPYMCLCRYFTLIKSGERAMKASVGASALFPDKSVQYQARKILKWAQHSALCQELQKMHHIVNLHRNSQPHLG